MSLFTEPEHKNEIGAQVPQINHISKYNVVQKLPFET